MTSRDWVMVIALGFGWGGVFIANAILLREIGPLSVSFLRVATGALAIWAVLLIARSATLPPRRDLFNLILFGVITYAFPFALFPAAQTQLAAGVAGIINAMTPIFMVVVSHFWPGGESATRNKVAGVLIGFCGIVILALPTLQQGGRSAAWAVLLALLGPVCYAIGFNLLRRVQHLDKGVLTAVAMTGAAAVMLPVMSMVEGAPVPLGAQSLVAVIIIGPVLTGFAFLAINHIAVRVGATNASTVTFVAPISAVLLGILILGERIAVWHLAGMAVIFLGLVVIDGRLLPTRFRHSQPKG